MSNKHSLKWIRTRFAKKSIQRGPFLKHLFPRHGLPGKFDLLAKSLKTLIPRNEDLFLLKNQNLNLKLSSLENLICFPNFQSWNFDLFSQAYKAGIRYLFPSPGNFQLFPSRYLFSYTKFNLFSMQCHLFGNRYLFSNLLCHLLEILICFPMMTSSAGTGKQMIVRKPFFLEIIICFPIFREKAISWKGETDILGKQPRWLLLKG